MQKDTVLVEDIRGTSERILHDNLGDGEPVYVFMEGRRGQSVAATDRRLMIIKTGISSGGSFFGKKCVSFPYDHITSLDCEKGMMMDGRLVVSVAGRYAERQGMLTNKPYRAENAVAFAGGSYKKFQIAMNKIRDLIEQYKRPRGRQVSEGASIPDQIKKLADLKESGILTTDEFERKKQELLERI